MVPTSVNLTDHAAAAAAIVWYLNRLGTLRLLKKCIDHCTANSVTSRRWTDDVGLDRCSVIGAWQAVSLPVWLLFSFPVIYDWTQTFVREDLMVFTVIVHRRDCMVDNLLIELCDGHVKDVGKVCVCVNI